MGAPFKHTRRGRLFGTAFRLAGRPIIRTYARKIMGNLETLEGRPSATSAMLTSRAGGSQV